MSIEINIKVKINFKKGQENSFPKITVNDCFCTSFTQNFGLKKDQSTFSEVK